MTIALWLDRGQRRRMTRLLRKTRSRIEALRARVVLLLHERVVPGVVAEMAGCARATVYRRRFPVPTWGRRSTYRRTHARFARVSGRRSGWRLGWSRPSGTSQTTIICEVVGPRSSECGGQGTAGRSVCSG